MSDDEYFGDDDVFTAAELDNIPLLNEPPPSASGASTAFSVDPPRLATPNPPRAGASAENPNRVAQAIAGPSRNPMGNESVQRDRSSTTGPAAFLTRASSSREPVQVVPVRRGNSRLSTIMNALRSSQNGQRLGESRILSILRGIYSNYQLPRPASGQFPA